jgi:VanZ family protein
LGWLSLIYSLSDRTGSEAADALVPLFWLGTIVDEVAHLVLYGGLATLTMWAFWSWRSAGYAEFRWVWLAAVLALLYGLTDEYHQTFVPGRSASLKDIITDGVGAMGAALAWFYLATHWAKLPWRSKGPAASAPATAD